MTLKELLRKFRRAPLPEWRKHPNPYLQLHIEVYPNYLKERDNGTYDPTKDPFLSSRYILIHPFKDFNDVEKELYRVRGGERNDL